MNCLQYQGLKRLNTHRRTPKGNIERKRINKYILIFGVIFVFIYTAGRIELKGEVSVMSLFQFRRAYLHFLPFIVMNFQFRCGCIHDSQEADPID